MRIRTLSFPGIDGGQTRRGDSDAQWAIYAAIAVTWVATRALAVVSVDVTPWMLHDLVRYRSWSVILATGTFPTADPTWQYPPGIAPLFVAADRLHVDYRWGYTLAILVVDAVLMAALLWAHAHRPRAAWSGPWLWALAGVVVGPIMVVRFDTVPTLLAALAVLLVAHPVRSAILATLGALTKVWPLLMLLVLPRRSLPRALAAAAVTGAVVLVIVGATMDGGLSFLANQRDRGLQIESVGALPYVLWNAVGGEGNFQMAYGSVQVLMAGAQPVALALTVLGAAVVALVAWWRLRGRLETVPPGDVALAVMVASVVASRVYSPQFNVWLVGLAAVALLDRATRMRLVAALIVVVSLVTQVVYPWSATQLKEGGALAVGAQSVRITVIVIAAVLALVAIRRQPRNSSPEQSPR